MEIDDPLTTDREMAEMIQKVGSFYETNEAREQLGLEPKEDLEGEYGKAATEQPPQPQGETGGGLFSQRRDGDYRQMAEGYPISDRSECDGTVVKGPQGGLRCVPTGSGGSEESGASVSGPEDIPEGGFSDDELPNVVDDITPDANAVDEGDVTPESVGAMKQALPSDFEGSAFWEEPERDKPLPSKGQPVAFGDNVGVMTDIDGVGEDGLPENLVIETADGTQNVPPEDISHVFNEDADTDATDTEEEPVAESRDPQEIRENTTEKPDVADEVSQYVENAENPQSVGASFDDEIGIFGITKEEVVEEGVDVPRFSTSGANSEDQVKEFTENVVEARERGWLDGLEGGVKLPSNNLNLPEGAQGTFKPGVRNFAGEKIRDTNDRKAEININPDQNEEWDGEQQYIPFGPDEASKMEYAVSHEFGHSQHYNNLIEERDVTVEKIESDEFQSELQDEVREHKDAIAEEFSALAANNPFEFAADTFSALAVGADVSDEVLEAYDKIEGVTP
jgi:hypothetical protein